MKRIIKKKYLAALVVFGIAAASTAQAQLAPLSASYNQEQYLVNPAMAGLNQELAVNIAYRQQFNSMPGAPETQSVTGNYGFNKVGLGINIQNDKAGLQKWTRALATYAYHLKFDETHKLHFGLSLGFSNESIDNSRVNGSQNDVLVAQYNDRDTYLDGDFGMAYTAGDFTVQGSIPNLKTAVNKDIQMEVADRATFYSAISYKFDLGTSGVGIEPKLCYRGVKGLKNITDAGANVTFLGNALNAFAMYHSTSRATFGVGVQYKAVNIGGVYTNQTSEIRSSTTGDFELNLRISLFKQ